MSTSGGGAVNALLYVVVLALGLQVAVGRLHGLRPERGGLVSAALVWLVVAVPSLLQFRFPALLTHLERDPALVRDGQWWRILTGLVVQDGGGGGTVFNLAVLAVVAVLAGQVWGPLGLPVVFLLAHLAFAVPAALLSSDVGAGNSGATFGLATTLVGAALARRPTRAETARAAGVLLAGVVLVVLLDAHGIPVLAGPVIGVAGATAVDRRPGTDRRMADSGTS